MAAVPKPSTFIVSSKKDLCKILSGSEASRKKIAEIMKKAKEFREQCLVEDNNK